MKREDVVFYRVKQKDKRRVCNRVGFFKGPGSSALIGTLLLPIPV